VERLRFQAVHASDVADAYRLAVIGDAKGAFNLAADPPIGPAELAEILHARRLKLPAALLRAGAAATYALHLQPTEPGWVDMALGVPLMSSSRARAELDWQPRVNACDTVRELIEGIRQGRDEMTPPLARQASGPGRVREFLTRVGGEN
jgi:nucleoside-diphosphate-sugar epimerase